MSDLIMLVDEHHHTSGSQKCYKVTFTCETRGVQALSRNKHVVKEQIQFKLQ